MNDEKKKKKKTKKCDENGKCYFRGNFSGSDFIFKL